MTREAARAGFERFVDDAIEYTMAQFSVARALREGTRGPGGRVVDRLLTNSETLRRRVVQPELDAYRDRILRQFDIVLDYAAGDEPIDAYREQLLAADSYAQALRSDVSRERRAEIHDRLVERQRQLGEAVAPVVAASATEFWPAVRAAFDRGQAVELVEDHFTFTAPLREYRHAFEMRTAFDAADVVSGVGSLLGRGLPTVEVEYTDEAVRSLRRAEQRVVEEARREIDRQF